MATTKKATTKKKTTPKKEIKKTWKIAPVPVAGGTLWSAYKLRNADRPDEDGNREMRGGFWQTAKEAQNLADLWNEEGKE